MTEMDAEKLRTLIAKATDSDLSDGGRYFHEDCSDLTQCGHGDTGEYRNRHDGKLVEMLWNSRAAILAMAEERDRLATLARANNDLARHEAKGRRELQAENARLRETLERIATGKNTAAAIAARAALTTASTEKGEGE